MRITEGAKNLAGWEIVYGDRSRYSSRDGAWSDAPSDGVQMVSVYYRETYVRRRDGKELVENYKTEIHSYDYYWKIGDIFFGGFAEDVPKGAEGVKLGIEIASDDFYSIYNQEHQKRSWTD